MPTQTENFIAFTKGCSEKTITFLARTAPHQLREELNAKFGDNISEIAKQIFCINNK